MAVGQPRRGQEAAYVRRLAHAALGTLAAGGQHLPRAAVHREHRGQLVEGLPDRAHAEVAHDAQQRAEEEPDVLPGEAARRHVGQRGEERGAPLLVVGVAPGQRRATYAAVRGLGVEDHRLRHHERAVAGEGGAPAEVDVVAEDRQLLVEPAQGLEHVAPHQHAGGVDREHLAHGVVLALVVLAALETGLAVTGAGDGQADLEEPPQ